LTRSDSSDGFSSKIFDLSQVGAIFCCLGRVRPAIFGFSLSGFGKFLLKIPNFQLFLGQKKSYQGWVKKYLGHIQSVYLMVNGGAVIRTSRNKTNEILTVYMRKSQVLHVIHESIIFAVGKFCQLDLPVKFASLFTD